MNNNGSDGCEKKRAEAAMCSLETGQVLTKPIGFIESCFTAKNGTPRQPSVCSLSRGRLKIDKSVFNNPEHSVMGLEQFSHLWLLFIFHKNGRLSCKAKVQPPRLNGAKTGVFSTRSPHRPNAIGLTLAKLDKIEGGILYLSGIDLIQGTPVIDIKPYISEYDSPRHMDDFVEKPLECLETSEGRESTLGNQPHISLEPSNIMCHNIEYRLDNKSERSSSSSEILGSHKENVALEINKLPFPKDLCSLKESTDRHYGEDLNLLDEKTEFTSPPSTNIKNGNATADASESFVATWVTDSPVPSLKVRFTQHAEMELKQFRSQCDSGRRSFRYFQSPDEAKCAISTVLSADPRSVYRRNRCHDRLFYFSLDTMHITCWFGHDFAEVLRIQPVTEPSAT
ncbi:tRNA (adenine(37)-N6)-methyltransferase [Gastrophryne carolinensis]